MQARSEEAVVCWESIEQSCPTQNKKERGLGLRTAGPMQGSKYPNKLSKKTEMDWSFATENNCPVEV